MFPPSIMRLLSAAALLAGAVGLASAQPAPLPPEEASPTVVQTTPAGPVAPASSAPAPAAAAVLPPEEPAPSDSSPDEAPLSSASGAPAKPAPPKRTLYTAAVIQVLDKVTAENLRFEAPLHKFIRYKGLIFLVNTCQTDSSEPPVTAAHLEIDSQPPAMAGHPQNAVKLVYRGWMFADAPGPHPFEHPIYDAWLIACKTASPGA